MSKQVRWQIPFVSRLGTAYRVDIYDEQDGSWSGVQTLTGGTNPFTTSEDDSDDYFAPIRTQSGTIEVCTLMPDGNYITLDDLLPANNIARPVKLWRILGGGAVGILEWQGFLSCEAYNQDYTSIPQILQLPVISVLEAMASVQLDPTRSSGLATIAAATYNALNEINVQCGMSFYTHIRYSMTSWRIFQKMIDQTAFFKENEQTNEYYTSYITDGISAQEALKRLCTFMGWIAREQGTEILLEYIGENIGMYQETFAGFGTNFHPTGTPSAQIYSADISDFDWMGTEHKRTIMQGAKSVAVSAKLDKYNASFSLPPCPEVSLAEYIRRLRTEGQYLHALVCTDDQFYAARCSFNYYYAELQYIGRFTKGASCTLEQVISRCALNWGLWTSSVDAETPVQYKYMGAFFARIWHQTSNSSTPEYTDGLYISGMHNRTTGTISTSHKFDNGNEVCILKGTKEYILRNGKLVINASAKLAHNASNSYGTSGQYGYCDWDDIGSYSIGCWIKFGDKYYNRLQNRWSTEYDSFFLDFGYEMRVPITDEMKGEISVGFFGTTVYEYGTDKFDMYDVFITKFDVSFSPNITGIESDRSENHYFRLLGTNFRDEISIGADLASTLNNQPSPSLIMNSETEAMTELNYGTDQVPDMRRPEVDLLDRLADYYQAARHRLSLIVAHPTAAPLPLLRLNGINDGKVYLPLAESRDWQQETSTLTCFEMPS